jgi:hypothetical protein
MPPSTGCGANCSAPKQGTASRLASYGDAVSAPVGSQVPECGQIFLLGPCGSRPEEDGGRAASGPRRLSRWSRLRTACRSSAGDWPGAHSCRPASSARSRGVRTSSIRTRLPASVGPELELRVRQDHSGLRRPVVAEAVEARGWWPSPSRRARPTAAGALGVVDRLVVAALGRLGRRGEDGLRQPVGLA